MVSTRVIVFYLTRLSVFPVVSLNELKTAKKKKQNKIRTSNCANMIKNVSKSILV